MLRATDAFAVVQLLLPEEGVIFREARPLELQMSKSDTSKGTYNILYFEKRITRNTHMPHKVIMDHVIFNQKCLQKMFKFHLCYRKAHH